MRDDNCHSESDFDLCFDEFCFPASNPLWLLRFTWRWTSGKKKWFWCSEQHSVWNALPWWTVLRRLKFCTNCTGVCRGLTNILPTSTKVKCFFSSFFFFSLFLFLFVWEILYAGNWHSTVVSGFGSEERLHTYMMRRGLATGLIINVFQSWFKIWMCPHDNFFFFFQTEENVVNWLILQMWQVPFLGLPPSSFIGIWSSITFFIKDRL